MLCEAMQPDGVCDGDVIERAENRTEERAPVRGQLSGAERLRGFERALVHCAVVGGKERCGFWGHGNV